MSEMERERWMRSIDRVLRELKGEPRDGSGDVLSRDAEEIDGDVGSRDDER